MEDYEKNGTALPNEVSIENGEFLGILEFTREINNVCTVKGIQNVNIIAYGEVGSGKTSILKNLNKTDKFKDAKIFFRDAQGFSTESVSPIPMRDKNGDLSPHFMIDKVLNTSCDSCYTVLVVDEFDRAQPKNLQRIISAYADLGNPFISPKNAPLIVMLGNGGFDSGTIAPQNNILGRSLTFIVHEEGKKSAFENDINDNFIALRKKQSNRSEGYYATARPVTTLRNKRSMQWLNIAFTLATTTHTQFMPLLNKIIAGLFEEETRSQVQTRIDLMMLGLPSLYEIGSFTTNDANILSRHIELLIEEAFTRSDWQLIETYVIACRLNEQLAAFREIRDRAKMF